MNVKIKQARDDDPKDKGRWIDAVMDDRHVRPSVDWNEAARHCTPGHHPVELFHD